MKRESLLGKESRSIRLDTIECDFLGLKLIGIHTGWPWVEEMISVSWKHQNVYIGSDAYAPKYWKREFINFINSWGQDKVLFGTDFPIIEFERATIDSQVFADAHKGENLHVPVVHDPVLGVAE